MNQDGMLKPALIGGVLLGVLSAVPLVNMGNCLCCAWVIGGGILAAHLYVRNSSKPVTLGNGLVLGLLTGAIGAVVDTIISIPLHFAMRGLGMEFARSMEQVLEQLPNMPPETRDTVRSLLAGSGSMSVILLVLGGFFKLVIYGIFAGIGGDIGVALFEKRKPGPPGTQSTGGYPPAGGYGPTGGYQPPPGYPPPPPPPPPFNPGS